MPMNSDKSAPIKTDLNVIPEVLVSTASDEVLLNIEVSKFPHSEIVDADPPPSLSAVHLISYVNSSGFIVVSFISLHRNLIYVDTRRYYLP